MTDRPTTIAAAVRELDARTPTQLPPTEAARRLSEQLGRKVSRQSVHHARAASGAPVGRPHGDLEAGIAVRLPSHVARAYGATAKRQGCTIRDLVLEALYRDLGMGSVADRWGLRRRKSKRAHKKPKKTTRRVK